MKGGSNINYYVDENINRKSLKPNTYVEIVVGDTEIVRGKIKEVISKKAPKDGLIKVKLQSGKVGKVIKIITKEEIQLENFKILNLFFHSKSHYTIYNKKDKKYSLMEKEKHNRKITYLMIFSSKELAESTLKRSKCNDENHQVVKLNPNKNLYKNVQHINADFVLIDMKRTIIKSKLKEYESKFLAI